MTSKILTIGFTKKTAQEFFELLMVNNVEMILDIRLNNTSQLAIFAKYPDIEYFLKVICNIAYIHDTRFSPTIETLKRYKKKEITWDEYIREFNQTMKKRNIIEYIKTNYSIDKKICLLCSEEESKHCHRSLVANMFSQTFNELKITHI